MDGEGGGGEGGREGAGVIPCVLADPDLKPMR